MAGIAVSNILQPGNIAITGGVTRSLVSDLQLLTPQYYKNYVEKYGNEDFTWWLSTFGGMEEVKNRDYFWFENRGKLMTGVQIASNVAASTQGATITCTLASGFHFNSGTQAPIRAGETVRVASTNVEAEILAITGTTASAWTFTVRPKISTEALNSAGSANLLTTDALLFGGIRRDYVIYAKRNPDFFSRTKGSKEVEINFLVRKAISEAKIEINREPGKIYWAQGGGLICHCPTNIPPDKYLTDLALTPSEDGQRFKEQLQQFAA